MTRSTAAWRVPAALLLLSAIPVVAGAFRVFDLTGGGEVTAESARYFASPVPVLLHIVSATAYCVGGAFQFVPRLRRSGWHRLAGRLLVPCGLVAALSGLWMDLFHPGFPGDGPLLTAFRLAFGAVMVFGLVQGYLAARGRDFAGHRAWMVRAYAVGLGAGTQALVLIPWQLLVAPPVGTSRALLMALAWAINLAVAETVIRKARTRRSTRGRGTSVHRPHDRVGR